MTIRPTFRMMEASTRDSAPAASENWPLVQWYERLRDTPLDEFSDGDLSTACRQRVCLDQIIPVALCRLEQTPLAGELYDGELLVALASIPDDYWVHHAPLASAVRRICSQINLETDDAGISRAIRILRTPEK